MSQGIEKTGLFQKYTWLKWLILIPLATAGLYVTSQLVPKDFEKSSMFTQYGELSKDTIPSFVPIMEDTSTVTVADSLSMADSTAIGSQDSAMADVVVVLDSDLLDAPTLATVITKEHNLKEVGKKKDRLTEMNHYQPIALKGTAFEELFLPANETDSTKNYQAFFAENLVTTKAILKIVAITGKDVLINGNSINAKEIFESIVEEKSIISITLSDRKGKVVYTSNAKFLHGNIQTIYPTLDIQHHAIGWGSDQSKLMTSIAIHHTYGRIGNVVLVSWK